MFCIYCLLAMSGICSVLSFYFLYSSWKLKRELQKKCQKLMEIYQTGLLSERLRKINESLQK